MESMCDAGKAVGAALRGYAARTAFAAIFGDDGAGDDTLRGGGNDPLTKASHLIASSTRHSGAVGRFDCERRALKARNPCFRWRFERSNIKTVHARSMRLAGRKWLGGRMGAAWGSSGIQINPQTRKVPQ